VRVGLQWGWGGIGRTPPRGCGVVISRLGYSQYYDCSGGGGFDSGGPHQGVGKKVDTEDKTRFSVRLEGKAP